jgi:hypothetical protein
MTADELSAYVMDEDNGMTKVVKAGDTHVEVMYRPTDLWVHQELGGQSPDEVRVKEIRSRYELYYYFVLSLSRNEKEALHQLSGGMPQYSELVNTLSFRMHDYVNMTTSAQDTIPVGDFILNRTFGMSQSTDVLFVFSRQEVKESEWVQFNLNEFGLGVGNQRFRFRVKDLEGAPKIFPE